MASSGKKKTTMAKLNRESKLRERRAAKQARKTARKLGPPLDEVDELGVAIGEPETDEPVAVEEPVVQPLAND